MVLLGATGGRFVSVVWPRCGSAATRRPGAGRRRRSGRIYDIELLEGRVVPATITVLNANSDGSGSLHEAIDLANAMPGPDTITFAPSVGGTITLSGALPDLSGATAIEGPGSAALTVARSTAAGTPEFRIFNVTAGSEVTLSGLTITGGRALSPGIITSRSGGGIANSGTLTVVNSTLSGNQAVSGGGISNSGTLTVVSSTLSGNQGSGISNSGILTVINSTLSGNSPTFLPFSFFSGGSGGNGISNSGVLTVVNSTLSGNHATRGGGIDNSGVSTVINSTLSGNSAFDSNFRTNPIPGLGGGIFNSGTLAVVNSTLNGNHADSGGGGIGNEGMPSIVNSTISGNDARFGGGIANTAGTLAVVNSTLSGNSAFQGGGISVRPFLGSVAPKVTSITSLFANTRGGNLDVQEGALFVSMGHNLFSDAPAVALDPIDLTDIDPRLGPLADNGGPTFTQALLPGSPAIDAGDFVAGVTMDQRGVSRPQGAVPDIGAFESIVGASIVLSTPTGTDAVGRSHTVTATVMAQGGQRLAGFPVTFRVADGPNAGTTGTTTPADGRTDADGHVSFTYTGAGGPGTDMIIASAAIGGGATIDSPPVNVVWKQLQVALAPAAETSPVGQSLTITATVTGEFGTPLSDIPVTFLILTGPNAGATGTTISADGLTDANGQIAFTYTGNGGAGTDSVVATATLPGGSLQVSSTATVTWTAAPPPPPPIAVAPTVLALQRFGFHGEPTTLVLSFSTALDPARAQDPRNYKLVAPRHHGRAVRLRAARYDAAARAVTLVPARRLPLHERFRLTVTGTAPGGLASSTGMLLDGSGSGRPGSDFVTRFGPDALAGSSDRAFNQVRYGWAGPGPFGGLQFASPPVAATAGSVSLPSVSAPRRR